MCILNVVCQIKKQKSEEIEKIVFILKTYRLKVIIYELL